MQDFRMETFIAVCRHRSFTKAAGELCITQPAVSQHIRFLERAYEVRLFNRQGKQLSLTPAGQLLLDAALTMKHDDLQLKERMRSVQQRRSYIFGATLTVAEYLLPATLPRFIAAHPRDRIELKVANTSDLLDRLDAGEIDFAVVEGNVPAGEYESLLYSTEQYVAAAEPGLARRLMGMPVEALTNQVLITREEGSGSREILESALAQRGMSLGDFSQVIELGSIGLIKRMVEDGLGVTFLYRVAVAQEERTGIIAVPQLKDFQVAHNIVFIYRKGTLFDDEYRQVFQELTAR